MASTISSNMSLVIPTIGQEPGPQWASDLNSSLSIIDSHNHAAGSGVQITTAGINIASDFLINANNLTLVKSVRFSPQSSVLSGASDLGCVFVSGVDLYFNDVNGNHVRITQSGGVAGTPGSIAGLASPASATYVSGSQTFVWQSAASTPAIMDAASLIIRNLSASSFGLTLSAPSLSNDYSLVLPTLPASQKIMTLDSSGNMAAAYTVDNSTIEVSVSNEIQVKALGIDTAQLKDGSVTQAKLNASVILVPSGSILPFGGTSAPTGYLLCDGTSYLQATYPNLFTAIGTAYGSADGTHFNVPDLRGQFLRGVSGSSTNDPDKTSRTAMNAGGNTGNNVGSVQTSQFGSHSHTFTTGGGGVNIGGIPAVGTNPSGTGTTSTSGGNETRPINAYVQFIIKT